MPINQEHTVIAGGGLAGSLLALVLAERGHKVSVFEKRPDLRGTEAEGGRSINLALSERGLYALKQVGLGDEVLALTIPMYGRLIHAVDGSTKHLPYSNNPNEFIRSISRPGLNKLLLEAASKNPQISLHFDTSVTSVLSHQNVLSVSDHRGVSKDVSYDVLFGADGAGSAIRAGLGLESPAFFSREMLEHGYKELEMPALPDGSHVMPNNALHIWPRGKYMLIALPNQDGSFTCTLFLPFEGAPGFNQLTDSDSVQQFFEAQFSDAVPLLPNLVDDFFSNPTGPLGTVRCSKWSLGGNALILGDAAHAIVPFFGQGMNCAFEDVSVLAEMLESGPASTGWPTLLSAFETRRIPDANAIADMALENYIEMRDLVADPHFQLRRSVSLLLEQRFPELFIPRYSLVSFNRLPYHRVMELGVLQNQLLHQLCDERDSGELKAVEDIDWELAEKLVKGLPRS